LRIQTKSFNKYFLKERSYELKPSFKKSGEQIQQEDLGKIKDLNLITENETQPFNYETKLKISQAIYKPRNASNVRDRFYTKPNDL